MTKNELIAGIKDRIRHPEANDTIIEMAIVATSMAEKEPSVDRCVEEMAKGWVNLMERVFPK